MKPTIYNFTQALHTPASSLSTLHDALVALDPSGLPRLNRTSRFAEAQIEWQEAKWLICMPLTSAAIPDMERISAHIKSLKSEWIAPYRLLRNEMRYQDSMGIEHCCDLVLQHLPAGRTFTEALASEPPQTLLEAIDALEVELLRLGLSHRNIKPENILWDGRRLIPIRYHYACREAGLDTAAFEQLRNALQQGNTQIINDIQATYNTPPNRITGHIWVGNTFEQMVCVEQPAGYGYVDTSNRIIIAPQFRWADDFHEGRAAIETHQGAMGLIDKHGRYIIPAQYEIVEYSHQTGLSQVRNNGLWATFDYQGQQLTEFTE